jgi:hypothetical protein
VPTPLYVFMWTDLPIAYITQREERLRENKENNPIQNSLGSTSRRASTERRKTKKNLYCFFYAD